MDKLKAFFQNLNLFQWLALIAFLFGIISVTNATLSLKSRLLAYLPIRTKKKFEKRFADLQRQLTEAETANRNLRRLLISVLSKLLTSVVGIIGAFLFFILVVFLEKLTLTGFVLFQFLCLTIGLLLLGWVLTDTKNIPELLRNLSNPLPLGKRVLELTYMGRAKGYITDREDFIRSLIKSKIFTDDERVQLFNLSFDLDRASINEYRTKPVHRDNGADDY